METHHPYIEVYGGWICLRDERDGTAVIAYKTGSDFLNTVGIRGNALWRWMCSLRDAGFTVEARLDMELYGRPDDLSPDGRAQWLHVTGWDPGKAREPRSISGLVQELKDKLGVKDVLPAEAPHSSPCWYPASPDCTCPDAS